MNRQCDDIRLDGQGPVYDQIKRAISGLIRSGSWKPGDRLPSEAQLSDYLETARMTINRALKELTEEGLLVRKRRAGTFVAQPESPSAILKIVDMASAIPARGQVYGYRCEVNETVPAPDTIAKRMRLAHGARLQHVQCLHTADGEIVEYEERWINLALLPQAGRADFSGQSPSGWLQRATPWTEAEHTVSAVNATPEQARRLGVAPGAALLVLERRTFHNEDVVTYARLTHPGTRHSMTERFGPG
ncbi:UTRA domain-containing protein [Maricaulis sp.]|jgi:GntR family histidine utilization transcriptional repressor|uniref:UTRA domain-containing protein n=1 Tax=Maricaulis sp. TaxID=1486257 RepID=UPI002625C4B6|nr:UTRA domain-containing protein [Maricaulis sp.]